MCNLITFVHKCGHEKSVEWVSRGETSLVCRHIFPLPRPLEDDCVDCIMAKEMQERQLDEEMETASYHSFDTEPGEIKEEKQAPIINPRSKPGITDEEIDHLIQETQATVQRREQERAERIRQERIEYAMSRRRLSRKQQADIAENAEFEQRCAAVARIQRSREERKKKMKHDDEEEDRKVHAKIHRLMRENGERKKSMELAEAEATGMDREEIERLRWKSVQKRKLRAQRMEREERIERLWSNLA
ncbi:hypothetical protein CJF31_00008528 [Rutstroemia sp. NJR-2017a BVV2]|nr:hypothetical protein CJF31_00008528 [Rutstroemia sp. NJR-2017a BVV2]